MPISSFLSESLIIIRISRRYMKSSLELQTAINLMSCFIPNIRSASCIPIKTVNAA